MLSLSPAKAYAATPEVRVSLPTGVIPVPVDDLRVSPIVLGSSAVYSHFVTANGGQTWSSVDTDTGTRN